MEVYITVDTECTEERIVSGVVRPPVGYDLMMRGRLHGYDPGLGTDLLIAELGRYDFRATFFVEAFCAEYFGIDGLSRVCLDLTNSGHDIQLHLHPNFRQPQWRRSGGVPVSDNIGEYDFEMQGQFLKRGRDLLVEAGVPRSSLVAFRAGNYGASNTTWEALRTQGFVLDSSLNIRYLDTDCHIAVDKPRIDLYQPLDGFWELPVSCFHEGRGYRHLEITAISSREMRLGLERLRQAGAQTATIVTHPGEFFVIDDHRRSLGRANRVNIARLRKLLAFLNTSRDQYEVRTISQLAKRLVNSPPHFEANPVAPPRGSAVLRCARTPVQLFKRFAMRPKLTF